MKITLVNCFTVMNEREISMAKLTIKDIAKLAGVSPTTVSLILNHKGDRFSDETIEKVLSIVEETNYYPDFFAQNLVNKNNKTIGVIIPTLGDLFFNGLFEGIEKVASDKGYSVILFHSDNSREKEERGLDFMLSRSVSGIILATPYVLDHERFTVIRRRCPILLMDRGITPRLEGQIAVDESGGMAEAMDKLSELGHRRIAYIREDHAYYNLQARFEAYCQGIKRNHLEGDPKLVITADLSVEGGYIAAKQLLDSGCDFTALCCANDYVAIGAYRAILQAGKKIPEDISVLGFDDINIAAYITPALSTVKQPIDELGMEAAHALIKKIEHPESPLENKTFGTHLKMRESIAKAPDKVK